MSSCLVASLLTLHNLAVTCVCLVEEPKRYHQLWTVYMLIKPNRYQTLLRRKITNSDCLKNLQNLWKIGLYEDLQGCENSLKLSTFTIKISSLNLYKTEIYLCGKTPTKSKIGLWKNVGTEKETLSKRWTLWSLNAARCPMFKPVVDDDSPNLMMSVLKKNNGSLDPW